MAAIQSGPSAGDTLNTFSITGSSMKTQPNLFTLPLQTKVTSHGFAILLVLIFTSFSQSDESKMRIETAPFGKTSDGQNVTKFALVNANGNTVEMIDYGAIVTSILVPDRNGKRTNVTAGFSSMTGYLSKHPYFGATVGRFCNRIAKGKFSIDGKSY
ncbi:MAG: hypothetical protein ABL921_14105, partial [Pirellula sp.]